MKKFWAGGARPSRPLDPPLSFNVVQVNLFYTELRKEVIL